nr:cyclic nucleotide gated cation channel [Hymenolepis microstoma]
MHRNNPPKRHSDSSRLRKYSEILLPRSVSQTLKRSHREFGSFEMNRERNGKSSHDSLLYCPRRQNPIISVEREDSPSMQGQSTRGTRSWQRLRKAILFRSSTLTADRKERNNDDFLDFFSTLKRPSQNSYCEKRCTTSRNDTKNQKPPPINDQFPFEGFNKLSDSRSIRDESKPTHDLFSPIEIKQHSLRIYRTSDKEVKVNVPSSKPLHIYQAQPKHNASCSAESVSVQIEEWGGLEDGCPPDPGSSQYEYKNPWYSRLQFLKYCLPKRARFAKSSNSCDANTSENSNTLSHSRSTHFICNPQGKFMFIWLGIVAMATVYNLWTAILRQAFHEVQKGRTALWIGLDGVADLIYLADIMVQFRTSYLEKGLVVKDTRKIATRYLWSRNFASDSLALIPLDLFQLVIGIQPLLRFPRFLKCFRAWHWKIMVENRTTFPNTWRVLTLTHILFLGCHWFASIYYILSESTHFQDPWGYPAPVTPELQSLLRKYLQCFYWATVTLTTIGDINDPSVTFQ